MGYFFSWQYPRSAFATVNETSYINSEAFSVFARSEPLAASGSVAGRGVISSRSSSRGMQSRGDPDCFYDKGRNIENQDRLKYNSLNKRKNFSTAEEALISKNFPYGWAVMCLYISDVFNGRET